MAKEKTKTTATGGPHQRADAVRNRGKLLVAADAVFKRRGADASMEDVARCAKVGIGTLYRHFPTREALLAAACDEALVLLAREAEGTAKTVSPAMAVERFLSDLASYAGMYTGLAAQLGVVFESDTNGCHAATAAGQALLRNAQVKGEIRRDVQFDDLVCMASAISLAVARTPSNARRVPRLVKMFIDGLRANPRLLPKK